METPPKESEAAYMARLQEAHTTSLEYVQRFWELSQKTNRHEDAMLVWFVGLAAGGVLLALQIPERYIASSSQLLLAVLPWVASVLFGIAARWVLSVMQQEVDRATLKRSFNIAILPARSPMTTKEFAEKMKRFTLGPEEQEGQDIDRWRKCATWLQRATVVTFALGAVLVWGGVAYPMIGFRSVSQGEHSAGRTPGDAMALAVVEALTAATNAKIVECPPYFVFPSGTYDEQTCIEAGQDLSVQDVEAVVSPVLGDFGGWLQNPPGWVGNPGRIGAEFGTFRGNSAEGAHSVEIGVAGTQIVVTDRMISRGE